MTARSAGAGSDGCEVGPLLAGARARDVRLVSWAPRAAPATPNPSPIPAPPPCCPPASSRPVLLRARVRGRRQDESGGGAQHVRVSSLAWRGGVDRGRPRARFSPDPSVSCRLNNPFLPQTSRLQPKREPSPVSGECGTLAAEVVVAREGAGSWLGFRSGPGQRPRAYSRGAGGKDGVADEGSSKLGPGGLCIGLSAF